MSWGYTAANGPSTWQVTGTAQSPVNITAAQYDASLAGMTINYKAESQYTAENTGTSFKVGLANVSDLSGGPVNGCYKLEQFHLHWGPNDTEGAEHTIDGRTYAAELHLVHWNSTKYGNFKEAACESDGLAVVAVMIQAGAANPAFQEMVAAAGKVNKCGATCAVTKTFNPSVLLPANTKQFYTYHGSLTTPPCRESVQWIVFKTPVEYSTNQLNALRSLLSSEASGCITTNFRPIMPIAGRAISASFQ